jgi:hypothetical protein
MSSTFLGKFAAKYFLTVAAIINGYFLPLLVRCR